MDRRWVQAYERGVPPALSYPRTSLQHFLAASADRFPSRAALLFYGRPMSYRELDRATNRFANALKGLGVRKGDRVAVMLPNIPQSVIAYYGALKLGAVVVQVRKVAMVMEEGQQPTDFVLVSAFNSGLGIPKEELPLIFDRYRILQ